MNENRRSSGDLAVLGSPPAFATMLSAGQQYFASWERYESAFRGIFERQYYTNQGPLAAELERRLQTFLGVKHAVCVTNHGIALVMAAEAMGLAGKVIVPGLSHIRTVQSLTWAGLEPVFCDVDPATGHIDPDAAASLIDAETSAILGVNLWGGACDHAALQAFADRHGISLYFDSSHAFGSIADGTRVGNFGRAEVFSFHADNVVNAADGACICTNDDALAAKLRNIRSSYGAGPPVEVVKTSNGRMSEAQAALALLGLEDYVGNQARNASLFARYQAVLSGIPGLRVVPACSVDQSNHQHLVCEVQEATFGLSRDLLLQVLNAENVGARRPLHPIGYGSTLYPSASYARLPTTEGMNRSLLQLPLGMQVTGEAVDRIGDSLRIAHRYAAQIRRKLGA